MCLSSAGGKDSCDASVDAVRDDGVTKADTPDANAVATATTETTDFMFCSLFLTGFVLMGNSNLIEHVSPHHRRRAD